MSLALHYWMGDAHRFSGPPSPKWPILCRVGHLTLVYHTIPKRWAQEKEKGNGRREVVWGRGRGLAPRREMLAPPLLRTPAPLFLDEQLVPHWDFDVVRDMRCNRVTFWFVSSLFPVVFVFKAQYFLLIIGLYCNCTLLRIILFSYLASQDRISLTFEFFHHLAQKFGWSQERSNVFTCLYSCHVYFHSLGVARVPRWTACCDAACWRARPFVLGVQADGCVVDLLMLCLGWLFLFYEAVLLLNKNLCGRDGRTICGPQCVPKSTYVTLAHKRKQKFFYFGCSLVRRFYCKIKKTTSDNGTDGQTDRQTECDAICGPS